MSMLMTGDILEQWYNCQANFIYPSLALLFSPLPFLIVIFFYTLLGVAIAFRKRSQRVNSFFLSLYPFLFHCCFMVFYWCKSPYYLIIFEIACILIFLIGSIHHSLTLSYEILKFLVKLVRDVCKPKQVSPK